MKKIRNLLLILILLVIVFTAILTHLKKKKEESQFQVFEGEDDPSQGVLHYEESLVEEENFVSFYTVNDLIKDFIIANNMNNQNVLDNVLDSQDMNLDYGELKTDKNSFYLQKLLTRYNENNMEYYAYGYVEKNNTLEDVFFKVYFDRKNGTYSLLPIDYDTFKNVANENSNKILEKEIAKNEYNSYSFKNADIQDKCVFYLEDFTVKAKYNPEEAYNLLDEEYRNSKFGSLDTFKSFLKENLTDLEEITVESVGEIYENNYSQMRCKTNIGRNILIKETKLMKYSILLDDYTVQSEKEQEEYKNLTDKEKVSRSLNTIISLINNKDYTVLYNKMDRTFRDNNFKTEENFVEFIKENFFEYNIIGELTVSEKSGVYCCICKIKDSNRVAAKISRMTFYIVVNENGFVFSINNNNNDF